MITRTTLKPVTEKVTVLADTLHVGDVLRLRGLVPCTVRDLEIPLHASVNDELPGRNEPRYA